MGTHEAEPRLPPGLRSYLEPVFAPPEAALALPLASEPCADAWRGYAEEAGGSPVWHVIRARLPQLRFHVAEGVSREMAYVAATRRGDLSFAPPAEAGLALESADALTVRIHPTAAGDIAVLEPAGRADFETLLRAFAHRGEPVPVPPAMGAAIIGGFNNWDRVARLKEAWLAEGNDPVDWPAWFRAEVVPHKALYQDSFILLSDSPYSGVPARELGLGEAAWRNASRIIRLEHEATHYVTKRLCGSMRNNAFDELIADYCGLVAAFGRFDAGLFRRFMDVGSGARNGAEGRIRVYRGVPPLDDDAFELLGDLLSAAAGNLEVAHNVILGPTLNRPEAGPNDRAAVVLALCTLSIGDLAAPDAVTRVELALASVRTAARRMDRSGQGAGERA